MKTNDNSNKVNKMALTNENNINKTKDHSHTPF